MEWVDGGDGDQGQAEVADPLEQAVQGGLVDHRAPQGGGAVALVGEVQPVEPGDPPVVEVAVDPDLVGPGLRGGVPPDGALGVLGVLMGSFSDVAMPGR